MRQAEARPTQRQNKLILPPLLEAHYLCKTFSTPANSFSMRSSRSNGVARSGVAAVDNVSLELAAGETLAIVGESGSGKTTLARMLLRLIEPDSGKLLVEGRDFLAARGAELRALRREMQMVFQDPFASLDPRMRVGAIVAEPLEIHEPQLSRAERRARAVEILRAAGLGEDALARYPHEFSGGQRQRIGIARALVLRPRLVVADEPVSALDVSVGAQVLQLLQNLQRDFALTYLLISHSLPVVAQLATRIAVMQAGRIVETGPAAQILSAPMHPYTQSLIAAIPMLPAGIE
jgi:ABC-type microcin C transport system duplicated ATPase subunit YejF